MQLVIEPARLDDQLHATAVISAVGGATVTFHQTVRRHDALLVTGNIQIACVDRGTGRPTRLDAALRQQLEATLAATEEVT